MVFRGNGRRGGGQSSPKEYKEGLYKIDCRLTANGEEGAGIQEIYNKAHGVQVNFFEARPNPFPLPRRRCKLTGFLISVLLSFRPGAV